jgi:hypothetical protein
LAVSAFAKYGFDAEIKERRDSIDRYHHKVMFQYNKPPHTTSCGSAFPKNQRLVLRIFTGKSEWGETETGITPFYF